jgi:hypothetical protein
LSTTRIECPNCHRQTIKGKFCIYCGYTLETPQQPKPAPVEEVVQTPEQVPEIVAEAPEPAEAAVQTATEEVAVEEKRLVDQLASVYSWYFRAY